MSHNEETALVGWAAISQMFGKSVQSMIKRKKEFLESGVAFYSYYGRPPRKRICAFPSQLLRYTMVKGIRGDVI